jgi:CubicO group peptidase (beta-lactamase class C family)
MTPSRFRRALSLLALLTLASAAPESSTQDGANTLLRKRGEAFATALAAQGDALIVFAREHLAHKGTPPDLPQRFAEHMRTSIAELGPVERHTVQVLPGNTAVFVFCKHQRGGWQNYQFRVAGDDENRLRLVFRAIALEPMERPAVALGTPEASRWLETFASRIEATQPFSGVAVVRSHGREVFSLARGTRDAATAAPVSRATRFGMASGSKMFTAVAILQLAQAGKLSLDDPLSKHLPDFPNREFAARATLHQLLTHTAGAGDYWDDEYEKAWDGIADLKSMLPFVVKNLEPASNGRYGYSNSGYILLGLVVESLSGQSYYDYVQKHIVGPAKMVSTNFPRRGDAASDLARPYDPKMDAGAVVPGIYLPVHLGARGSSAGGAATTADDMLRFADALRGGLLLDSRHFELMTTPHVVMGESRAWSYGYGLIIDSRDGSVSYGHGGTARGTQFEFKIFPERDAVMVVMSNYNTIAPNELASALDGMIRQR